MKYDAEYITKYMVEYDSGVPISVVIGIFLLVCAIIIVLFHYSINGIKLLKNISWSILGGYLSFIFCTTILFRDKTEEIHYVLDPFWSYYVLDNRLLAEIILNVLLFIPIGFLVCCGLRKKGLLKIMGISCCISLAIEILQLVTRRGVFNIDDVIHNTIGGIIGYGIYRLVSMVIRKNFPVSNLPSYPEK